MARHTSVLFIMFVSALSGLCSSAAAQTGASDRRDETVLFVVASTGDAPPAWVETATRQLSDVARSLRHAAEDPVQAASEFERAHSTEPEAVRGDDIQTFKTLIKTAMSHLAELNHAAALEEFHSAFKLYEGSQDYFNKTMASDVLDACLFWGRALIETGANPQDIDKHLWRCRMLVPRDVEPRMIKHTSIASAWARTLRRVHEQSDARLEVECKTGCVVSVDGIPGGHARPRWEVSQQVVGAEYRISAECLKGRPGRVHRVTLREGVNRVPVDCELENAVHSRPVLHLLYPSAGELTSQVSGTAAALLQSLSLDSLVVAIAGEQGVTLGLIRRSSGELVGRAELGSPTSGATPWPAEQVAEALQALWTSASRRNVAAASPLPAVESPEEEVVAPPPPDPMQRPRRAGKALVLIGAATYASALALQMTAAARDRKVPPSEAYLDVNNPDYAPSGKHPDADRAEKALIYAHALGVVSTLPLAVGFGSLDRARGPVPYARWARITVPLVFVAMVGMTTLEAYLAKHGCDDDPNDDVQCAARNIHFGRASMFGSAAASLLAPALLLPLTRRLERRSEDSAQALNLRFSGNGLFVSGSFQ